MFKKTFIASEARVLELIVEILRLLPEFQKDLPEGCVKHAFWRKQFHRNPETERMLELMREMPAFNEQAPTRHTAAAWRAVLMTGYGNSLPVVLRNLLTRAARKPVKRPPIRRWRDAFGPNEKIQRVRPPESNAWIPNPHRGTTTFQRFQGDPLYPCWVWSDTHGPTEFKNLKGKTPPENEKYVPRTTLTYCRWPWAWLEPRKGQYRWDIIDGALAAAHARGQTAQLRFEPYTSRVDYDKTPCAAKRHPSQRSVNVPDWYWDTGARWIRKGVYAANEPDSNDPRYIKHFGDFIRAFAKRYDGHPDVESVDIAYAGFWGESGGNATATTGSTLTRIYLRSFKRTQLISMLGTPGCGFAAKITQGMRTHVGWRADCFGDLRNPNVPEIPRGTAWNHTFAYPRLIAKHGITEAWRSAPITMESCGTVTSWYQDDYDFDVIMREGLRYHMSVLMPKSTFFPKAVRNKIIEFDKRIGYRFALREILLPLEAKRGERITADFLIDNVGCAPIYRPYRLALRFRQGRKSAVVALKQDIRTWMPGHACFSEKIPIPRTLKPGEAKVDFVILGDQNQPRVWFALDAKTSDGWHPLTCIDLK